VSPSTVSELNKKIYGTIEAWRHRPIEGEHPYAYFDSIVLKRHWAGEVRNVSLLVAIGVNGEGFQDGICEGAKEDKAGWSAFLKHLKYGLTSSLSFLLCHPNAEATQLVIIDELDSGVFECRLNFDQS